jgi:hypothetical protein
MNPLHLDVLARDRVAEHHRAAATARAHRVLAAGRKQPEGEPSPRVPRGPRLRTPRMSGIRRLRTLLVGSAV